MVQMSCILIRRAQPEPHRDRRGVTPRPTSRALHAIIQGKQTATSGPHEMGLQGLQDS